MRRTSLFLFLLSTALLTTSPAIAQNWRVDVPFNFTAQNQDFRAGTYELAVSNHLNFIVLRSEKDPSKQMEFVAAQGDSNIAPPVIRFARAEDQYTLLNIQAGTRVTLPLHSRSKRDSKDAQNRKSAAVTALTR